MDGQLDKYLKNFNNNKSIKNLKSKNFANPKIYWCVALVGVKHTY